MIPEHIAIILDGNRRYAKKLGLKLLDGHKFGAENVKRLIEWCCEFSIKQLTVYAFSTENFNRSKREVKTIMQLFERFFNKLSSNKQLDKHGIRVRFIGNKLLFPENVQGAIDTLSEKTKYNNKLIVNFALGYGGRAEIVEAVKKISKKVRGGVMREEDITEDAVMKELYLSEEPDMIIRPGGEKRLSNFLPYQGTYSELFFIDKLWPEITKDDLKQAIDEFGTRERRGGR